MELAALLKYIWYFYIDWTCYVHNICVSIIRDNLGLLRKSNSVICTYISKYCTKLRFPQCKFPVFAVALQFFQMFMNRLWLYLANSFARSSLAQLSTKWKSGNPWCCKSHILSNLFHPFQSYWCHSVDFHNCKEYSKINRVKGLINCKQSANRFGLAFSFWCFNIL